jgi:hypothetical protein
MNTNSFVIKINPGRVLFGLSRIGYTPASALCDIIDNSVMAGATNINILIERENSAYNDNRRGNVSDYYIIDNGKGMSEQGLLKALELGSPDEGYASNTLSKFGLGLKSASFSQGDLLEIISAEDGNYIKYAVSIKEIQARGEYFASKKPIDSKDQKLIKQYIPAGHGTIVHVGEVRKEGHPPIKNTISELKKKVGVIYYYFIEEGLSIYLEESKLEGIDMLFTDEANSNGNLDENIWDGRKVAWIERPREIILDTQTGVKAIIEVTQLPHPPTFKDDGRGAQEAIREKYYIEASNYGYYVYRNKRLISWAESFPDNSGSSIIPNNQDLYSFRGRIHIGSTADDVFNIDVKKSTITLSDEAWNTISDSTNDYKRKSKKAWNRAKQLEKEKDNEEPNRISNTIAIEVNVPDTLPGEESVPQKIVDEIQKVIIDASKKRLENAETHLKQDIISSQVDNSKGLTEEEITNRVSAEALKGDDNPYATRIFRVSYTEDNVLWEPYYDAENGHCVRINALHRFSKLIYDENQKNLDLQIIYELMLHQFAISEIESLKYLRNMFDKINASDLEKLLAENRRYMSEFLANMCRKLEDKLPPINSD